MRHYIILLFIISCCTLQAQVKVDLKKFNNKNGAIAISKGNELSVSWPAGENKTGKLIFDLAAEQPLFKSMELLDGSKNHQVASGLDPAFVLNVGKRNLETRKGWNIFFDKVPVKRFKSHAVDLRKHSVVVRSIGTRTVITIDSLKAPGFTGELEITLYNGSPLMNIAAVMSTAIDSTAILYDAALVSKSAVWKKIGWSDVHEQMQSKKPELNDTATAFEVKYRSIIGENS